MSDGLCHGVPGLSALFFSEDEAGKQRAKDICGECPIVMRCQEYGDSLPYGTHGIFGGKCETDRRRDKRNRQRAARTDRVAG